MSRASSEQACCRIGGDPFRNPGQRKGFRANLPAIRHDNIAKRTAVWRSGSGVSRNGCLHCLCCSVHAYRSASQHISCLQEHRRHKRTHQNSLASWRSRGRQGQRQKAGGGVAVTSSASGGSVFWMIPGPVRGPSPGPGSSNQGREVPRGHYTRL